MARVAVVGASGYTGAELLRILLGHPSVEVALVCAHKEAGKRVSQVHPSLRGICDAELVPFELARVRDAADIVFCALPHGASAGIVGQLADAGLRVLDLSADFRLRDVSVYRHWYGEHPRADLLAHAVYGCPELHRDAIREAALVAVPGCYPTASVLALAPLLARDLVDSRGLVVDAKSGVTGAGRAPTQGTHFPETAEGIRAYKLGGQHRHTSEIEQELSLVAGHDVRITFSPHLVPMSRGILVTAYASSRDGTTVDRCREAASAMYASSPSVAVLEAGEHADTLWVRGSNRAHVGYFVDSRTGRVIAQSAIDNLVKGASGQAVQCLNVMLGLDERTGLSGAAVYP
ncbi:MAG: N-acetyl-gamma-glutamyl-phosphate reductase [Deltaproteobacteria bacterium]|nr:N-acetyl-gamma-glutamyl-phosphate reductase [Deltaproteobacteria bacterium]